MVTNESGRARGSAENPGGAAVSTWNSLPWPRWEDDWRGILHEEAAQASLDRLLPALQTLIGQSASPERASANFGRWLQRTANQARLLDHLAHNVRTLEMAITLFAGSQFLTVIFLRDPSQFGPLLEQQQWTRGREPERFDAEARAAMAPYLAPTVQADDQAQARAALRRYQQAELLRIGLADLCGQIDLSSVAAQLSHLADAVVRACLDLAARRTGIDPHDFCVLALGKLGGSELNYSSDIDLVFLAAQDTTRFERLGRELIKILTQSTGDGFLYRVDMRLRPWGGVGPLVPTLEGYKSYLEQHARLWEKQALLKARVVAGSEEIGLAALDHAATVPLRTSSGERDGNQEAVRADILAMKAMTEAELHQQGREWGEVKLGKGSIRDVEFVTQYLQLVHGPSYPEVRSGNTLDALDRLGAAGLLRPDEQRVLVEGYVFLRTVEHHLQMLEYRQTNTLPAKPAELAYLAQRLGFHSGRDAADRFVARYQQHSAAIRAIYQHYLGAMTMSAPVNSGTQQTDNDVRKHLARMSPSYTANFTKAEIRRHAAMVERLTESNPVEVEAEELGEGLWQVTIVAYDYPGELSLICGLLFVHGFSIQDGHVFTYEAAAAGEDQTAPGRGTGQRPRRLRGDNGDVGTPVTSRAVAGGSAAGSAQSGDTRTKIVDVFTVRSVGGVVPADMWLRYDDDLTALLRLLAAGRQRDAQGKLATSMALALRELPAPGPTLQPIELEIDNESSERYTILRIRTSDTLGFLYEFTNALALTGLYISEVSVNSVGSRVDDMLYVTDRNGQKITSPEKLRELRATVVLIKHFTHLLPQSPNPQAALLHFHAYLSELLRRPTWPDELASLERPEVLQALARLLGVSDFLWEDFLRMQYGNLFPVMRDVDALQTAKMRDQLEAELEAALAAAPDGPARRDALNAFKDREMFRTDMRYIMGHLPGFEEFGFELTSLAEVVIAAAYRLCDAELRAKYGAPCLEEGGPAPLSICALGKCGGRELGFASDIELMFVYSGNGTTDGPAQVSTVEYYERLVPAVVQAIKARREGIFEIDLQLRPYGSAGSLAVSLNSFRRYFAPGGPAWPYERQALIRLRPIAGDPALGRQVAALRDQYVYEAGPFDVAAMRAMRERQIRYMVTAGSFNAKFSLGGLVDIEYLVQGLQINRGRENARLRATNTAQAMAALAEAGILTAEEHSFLRAAHAFLWRLIEALRVVRGNAKDLTVPAQDSDEFAFLARRLGYGHDMARLREDLTNYTAGVRRMLARM